MRKNSLMLKILSVLFVMVAASCTASPTPPAARSTASPAAESGTASAGPGPEQRWNDTLAAARREGAVRIYSVISSYTRENISAAFRKKFDIPVEWVTGGGSAELIAKMLLERRAGLYNADVLLGGTMSAMTALRPEAALDPLEPRLILPEVIDTGNWFQGRLWWVDKEKTHLAYAAIAMPSLVINTDMVRREELSSYRDLLNPKWKGKILMDEPTYGGPGTSWVSAVGSSIMGKAFLEELARQEPFMLRDRRIEQEWIARGRYPILIGGSTDTLTDFKRAGVSNIGVITPQEGTFLSQSTGAISVINRAPHPAAATVIANWVLSREGQTLICSSQGFQSARIDVPTDWVADWSLRQPGVKYHDEISLEAQLRKEEYIEFAKKIFATK